jgi:capsular exopolysaccharide synthesis family protein
LEAREQRVQMSEYFRVLFRGRWIIFLSFLTVVSLTAYLTHSMRPMYEAGTTILIEEPGGVDRTIFDFTSPFNVQTAITNQVEVLKSRTLSEEVIRSLQLSPYKDELEILREQTAAGDAISFDSKVQRLRESISVNQITDTDIIELKVVAHSSFEAAFLANAVAEEYYKQNLKASRGEVSEVRQFLEEQLDDIRYKLAQSEELLKEYKETQKMVALNTETAELVEQIAQFRAYYNTAETELSANLRRLDFLKKKLSDTKSNLVASIQDVTSPIIQEFENEISQKYGLIASLKAKGAPGTDVALQALEQEIEQIKNRQVEEARKIAASGVIPLDPIRTNQQLVDRIIEVETEIKSLTAEAESWRNIIDDADYTLEQVPEKELILARLTRDATLNEKIFLMLNEKYEESRISEAGKTANVRIIDPAKPPKAPFKPNKRLNIILGIILGLGLGVAVSFLLEFLDDSIKTSEDIERMGLVLLGTIPIVKMSEIAKKMRREGKYYSKEDMEKVESKLITRFSPKSPISEAYRSLRTNIHFANLDRPNKVILVSSSATKEGKSTTAANLAITVAQMGSKTLLLDSDLRRPAIHNFFKLDRNYGLTNYLIGTMSFDEVIKKSDINNLDIVTCGDIPPNPSEMLASRAMRNFLEEAKKRYDMIILDSPPVIAVTDAAILSTRVDGVIMVVASGFVNRREVQRAINLLRNVNARILGVLLNGLDIKKIYGSYYYYFHYYQYYYYYGSDKKERRRRRAKYYKAPEKEEEKA